MNGIGFRKGADHGTGCFLPEKTLTKEAGLKGFEPLTCGLRVRRYAELSYRPT